MSVEELMHTSATALQLQGHYRSTVHLGEDHNSAAARPRALGQRMTGGGPGLATAHGPTGVHPHRVVAHAVVLRREEVGDARGVVHMDAVRPTVSHMKVTVEGEDLRSQVSPRVVITAIEAMSRST